MDLATVIGVVAAIALMVWSILLGGTLMTYYDLPSIMITGGGTVCFMLISFPAMKVLRVFKVIRKTLLAKPPQPEVEIARITEFAQIARREGLLALEDRLAELKDPFLLKGVQLVIDGTPPEVLRDILSIEVENLQQRHAEGKTIMDQMGAAAPAFGMIGTLIGLVAMLKNLSDPSQIGAGMATALLTTLYGALVANIVCIPMSGKLDNRSKEEVLMKQIIIEGIISIQSGDNPRTIEEKLKSFVSPSVRARMTKKEAAG